MTFLMKGHNRLGDGYLGNCKPVLACMLPADTAALDRWAKSNGISRSEAIRRAVKAAVANAERMTKASRKPAQSETAGTP
jgi:hypothetical protein